MLKVISSAVIATAIMVSGAAKADIMKVEAFGAVTFNSNFSALPAAIGNQMRGTFTYDSALVGSYLSSSSGGVTSYSNVLNNAFSSNPVLLSSNLVNLTTGSTPLSMHNFYSQHNDGSIIIGPNALYEIVDRSGNAGSNLFTFYFQAFNPAGIVQSLTQTGAFSPTGQMVFIDGRDNSYIYTDLSQIVVTDLGPSPMVDVPEPASIAMLTVGLLGATVFRRRRQNETGLALARD